MYRPITQQIAPLHPGLVPPQVAIPYISQPITPQKIPKPTIVKKKPKKRKMDEFEIPDETLSLVPESKLVKELQEFEKRLDMSISSKKRYMKHMLAQTTNTPVALRIFVNHSVSHLIKETLDYSIFYWFSSQVTTRNYQ
jgi:hypothetical protein